MISSTTAKTMYLEGLDVKYHITSTIYSAASSGFKSCSVLFPEGSEVECTDLYAYIKSYGYSVEFKNNLLRIYW